MTNKKIKIRKIEPKEEDLENIIERNSRIRINESSSSEVYAQKGVECVTASAVNGLNLKNNYERKELVDKILKKYESKLRDGRLPPNDLKNLKKDFTEFEDYRIEIILGYNNDMYEKVKQGLINKKLFISMTDPSYTGDLHQVCVSGFDEEKNMFVIKDSLGGHLKKMEEEDFKEDFKKTCYRRSNEEYFAILFEKGETVNCKPSSFTNIKMRKKNPE